MQREIETMQGPAEIYDERFVPALFGQWGPIVCRAAGVAPGQRVLDVACGTGALALAASEIVGHAGEVVGLDANPEMLAVARRKPAPVAWVDGRAEQIPFGDASFDAVVSQFGMMFFDDPARALREMVRVLKPGGRLAVAVCDALEHSEGYREFWRLLDGLFGRSVAEAFAAPFTLGDPDRLRRICAAAELPDARIDRREGMVRFASIRDMVSTERACAWTLGGVLDDAQFDSLADAAETALSPFRSATGEMAFGMPVLIITASKPRG